MIVFQNEAEREVWMRVAAAVSVSSGIPTSEYAVDWADKITAAFRERNKPVDIPTE